MTGIERYDRLLTGIVTGLLLPVITGLTVFLFSHGDRSLHAYIGRITDADIITHTLTLCVLPNLFLFLAFNRLDMLRASRGVLGMTIAWAVIVFAVKFLR